jgi:hypothetical protein
MLGAGRQRGAIGGDCGVVTTAPAFKVADSEVRLGIVRRERNGPPPRGGRALGFESL